MLLRIIPFWILFFITSSGSAQPHLLTSEIEGEKIISRVFYLEDSTEKLTVNEVSSPDFNSKFKTTTSDNIGFKETVSCYWLKFEIKNNSITDGEWLIDFDKWVHVNCFVKDDDGTWKEKITGHLVPYNKRDYPSCNKNLISLKLKEGEGVTCFTRLQTTINHVLRPADLSFKVYKKEYYTRAKNRQDVIIAWFAGIFLVIFLYNFFIYFSTKDNNYILYLGFVFFNFLAGFQNFGYNFEAFRMIESYPDWYSYTEIIFSSIYGFIILSFTDRFLKIKEHFPGWHKIFNGIKISLAVIIIPALMGYTFIITNVSGLIGLITLTSVLIVAIKCYRKRFPSSGYFLLAQSAFIIGLMVYLLKEMFVFPVTDFTIYSAQIGASVEAVLFSFALANRINILQKDNEEKQENLILQLRENELLQTKVNRELEGKVAERTAALREAQNQLVQQEKLAALGQLTAGIAHEIKNPLNFVNNFSEMNAGLIEELKEAKNDEERNEILSELIANLQIINHHGKRADIIVTNMLLHSRISSGEKQLTDINELCDECLKLSLDTVRSKSPGFNCKIETFFVKKSPLVKIVSQDISRAIFNLLSNAFD